MKRAQNKQAGQPAKRKPGRSRRGVRVVTETILNQMGDLHLRGYSEREIAALVGVSASTVHTRITKDLRPRWKEAAVTRLEDDLARVALLERIAWEAWDRSQQDSQKHREIWQPSEEKPDPNSVPTGRARTKARKEIKEQLTAGGVPPKLVERVTEQVTNCGNAGYLQIVQWCIEFRGKVGGYFEKDTAGSHGVLPNVIEVVVDSPEQVPSMMTFQEYERKLGSVLKVDFSLRWRS